jgi:two-component system sensor histidine kinase KdpD
VRAEELLRPRQDRLVASVAPQAVGERLLALVTPRPSSQRIVRRAWRSAQRLGAELDLLWVAPPGAEPPAELDALRRLASVLGAHLLVEYGDRVADVVRRVAEERGSTYVLLGRPQHRRGLGRLREPLLLELLDALPGVDVRVIADRSHRSP